MWTMKYFSAVELIICKLIPQIKKQNLNVQNFLWRVTPAIDVRDHPGSEARSAERWVSRQDFQIIH